MIDGDYARDAKVFGSYIWVPNGTWNFPNTCSCQARWWFQTFFMFNPTWGNDPI